MIVPESPFAPESLTQVKHCLAALDVAKLMEWWPGTPHVPHRNPDKVRAIQRSLDWKRVAKIAAYLLQQEIRDTPEKLDQYFRSVYEPRKFEKGREWPPKVPNVTGYERSQYPMFSNVLLHVNGANVTPTNKQRGTGTANLSFNEKSRDLNFSVIDGQHRVNGAFFALQLLREVRGKTVTWEIPAEIFLDLDAAGAPPKHQAQIFIDVNFYQKKVDRSLVADLFPTARSRDAIDDIERAQDIGRRLMLETGPLVGMIQIPGINFGTPDVVSLATLNSAIEDAIPHLLSAGITSLAEQTEFLAICIEAWLDATGRKEHVDDGESLDPDNVAYQGRVLVSFLSLIPACIWKVQTSEAIFGSAQSKSLLTKWLRDVINRAGLLHGSQFLSKSQFKAKGYLGSGGLARFRDSLWAASLARNSIAKRGDESKAALAIANQKKIAEALSR
ncbi:MAG: hypothetical protein KF869_09775 [Phycisphaeraceae bacterium]|nr:hypothetical protein [Phycisphaeraceae bacterium]